MEHESGMALNLEKVCRMWRRDSYTTDIQPTLF